MAAVQEELNGTDFQIGWQVAVSAELHRIEELCRRSARGLGESARVWRTAHLLLGTATVLTGGVAGSLVLAGSPYPVAAGALALVAALFATLGGMIGPARREAQAAEAAKGYQVVEALSRQARCVDLPGLSFERARRVLTELTEHWQGVNRVAPTMLRWGQRRADRMLAAEPGDELLTGRASDVVRIFRVWPRSPADDLDP